MIHKNVTLNDKTGIVVVELGYKNVKMCVRPVNEKADDTKRNGVAILFLDDDGSDNQLSDSNIAPSVMLSFKTIECVEAIERQIAEVKEILNK